MRTAKLYFATCQGNVVTLTGAYSKLGDNTDPANWRGKCPLCGKTHKVERIIHRPVEPSNHECDARCIHATGQKCQCKCGGENHGIGGLGISILGKAS